MGADAQHCDAGTAGRFCNKHDDVHDDYSRVTNSSTASSGGGTGLELNIDSNAMMEGTGLNLTLLPDEIHVPGNLSLHQSYGSVLLPLASVPSPLEAARQLFNQKYHVECWRPDRAVNVSLSGHLGLPPHYEITGLLIFQPCHAMAPSISSLLAF